MNKFFEKIKSIVDKAKPIIDKAKKHNDIIVPTAVLTVICIVVTLALSSANLLTETKIKKLAEEKQNQTMSKLIVDADFVPCDTNNDKQVDYYIAKKDGKSIGLIIITNAKGYSGGVVSVMSAIDTEGALIAVEILAAADETPGLGQNVTKAEWLAQFVGLKDKITVIKGGTANSDNDEINAVTGATISSKAVSSAVNQALNYAKEIIAKGDELK